MIMKNLIKSRNLFMIKRFKISNKSYKNYKNCIMKKILKANNIKNKYKE